MQTLHQQLSLNFQALHLPLQYQYLRITLYIVAHFPTYSSLFSQSHVFASTCTLFCRTRMTIHPPGEWVAPDVFGGVGGGTSGTWRSSCSLPPPPKSSSARLLLLMIHDTYSRRYRRHCRLSMTQGLLSGCLIDLSAGRKFTWK